MAIPKIIIIYFFILTFAFGMDFGFTKIFNKKLHSVSKLVSTTVSLVIIVILVSPLKKTGHVDFYWYTIIFLQFLCYFIVFKFSKYTVYDFLLDLHGININLSQINKFNIGVALWVYSSLLLSSKLYLLYYYCEVFYPDSCVMDYYPYLVYSIPSHGVDFMFIVLILIYCYIYYCVKDLNKLLKRDKNISLITKQYIAIVGRYDKIRPFYAKLITVELLEIPRMMGLIYNVLIYMLKGNSMLTCVGKYFHASNIISKIVGSGAIVQMVIFQVEALKIQLHSMLLDEEDVVKSKEIKTFLEYLNARRLDHPVAGVIPVDLRLATTTLGIFATYMIVLVQFTHLVE